MDLKDVRIRRLSRFAASRGLTDNPARLGELIGKKPNQVYNLLSGQASFGEKVARSIEDAAGLPRGWLDSDDPKVKNDLLPEVADLAQVINELQDKDREFVVWTAHEAVRLARKFHEDRQEALSQTPSPTESHPPRTNPKRVGRR